MDKIPIEGDTIYRNRQQLLANMLTEFQTIIPEVYIGEDGQLRLLLDVVSGSVEGIFIAAQIIGEDMFVQTASLSALLRYGEMYGIPRKGGTKAEGTGYFTGTGGTFIPINAEVLYDPGSGIDPLSYFTTSSGNIANPGIPTAPTLADAGAGAMGAGTYEYVVTFQVDDGVTVGETAAGAISAPITIAASHQIDISDIPLGGPGTTGRMLYRRVDGGVWKLAGTYGAAGTTDTDNVPTASLLGIEPPEESTAEFISLPLEAEESGVDYNVGVGIITTLSDVPDGVLAVTNITEMTGGSEIEDTEKYRERMLRQIRSPGTGSASDIKAWSEAIEGVEIATVYSNDNLGTPTNGHVTVRIVGVGGTIADAELIDAVLATLIERDLATITIHVATFAAQPEDVTVDVTLATGYILSEITPQVVQAIEGYINSLNAEATMYISGIVDAVFGLIGILDVVVTTPATNQTAAAGTKITPGTIVVS